MIFDKLNANNKKFDVIIGVDTKIEGKIISKGSVRIDGEVEGDIECEGISIIGLGAKIKGNITSEYIELSGNVEGNITSKGSIKIFESGQLKGDVSGTSITIDEGATFDGNCHVKKESEKPELKDVSNNKTPFNKEDNKKEKVAK